MSKRCDACAYSVPDKAGASLFCALNPPQIVVIRDRPVSLLPNVEPGGRCACFTAPTPASALGIHVNHLGGR